MKTNHNKCHYLVSGKKCVTMNICGFEIENTEWEKLLGTRADCKLKFTYHFDWCY